MPTVTDVGWPPGAVLTVVPAGAGVVIQRLSSPARGPDNGDYYAIELTQSREYFLSLSGIKGNRLTVLDASGERSARAERSEIPKGYTST